MESKVCKVTNSKRNYSDDDDNNRDAKQRRHNNRDRHTIKDKYDKSGRHRYEDLKVGDPYYSGGIVADSHKGKDHYHDESRHRRRHRSQDRHEKENRSRNVDNQTEEKIGAPYYSGGMAAVERESGEESSDYENEKVGQ